MIGGSKHGAGLRRTGWYVLRELAREDWKGEKKWSGVSKPWCFLVLSNLRGGGLPLWATGKVCTRECTERLGFADLQDHALTSEG